MSRPHRTAAGWLRFGGPILICAATLSAPDSALAQAPDTHLGVPANRMINLVSDVNEDGACSRIGATPYRLVRVRPNGNMATEAFVVPANQVFVLTDVTWSSRGTFDANLIPGRSLRIIILVYPESSPSNKEAVHRLPRVIIPAGTEVVPLGDSQHLTAGVRIAAGHGICLAAAQTTISGSVTAWMEFVNLQGYTIAAK